MLAEQAATDTCEIIGDRGNLRFSFFRVSTIELNNEDGKQFIEASYPENIQLPHIRNVVQYFRGEGPNPLFTGRSLVTMQIMDQAKL